MPQFRPPDQPIAALSSAARTPGSSWAKTNPRSFGSGAKSAAKSSPKTSRTTSSSSSGGDRGPQSALVRAQYRPGRHRCPAPGPAPGAAMDGGHPGRHGRGHRGGVRGQIHAAVVVLGRSGSRKAHGPAAAQYVGDQCQGLGALDHHRRRQMGRDPIPADSLYQHLLLTAEKKFWRCVENGEPPRLYGVEPPGPGSQRFAWST